MAEGPPISVALATYNGAAFLGEQLASLLAQTVLPHELVVGDDGSSDDTLAIVSRFAATAPFPVRVLARDQRLGFADNFLHVASQCAGELIAFCDQDDVWLPDKLAEGRRRIVADDSLLSMHTLTLTDRALRPIGVHGQAIAGDAVFDPLDLDPHNTGWGNTMMFRRELAGLIPRELRPRQPGLDRPLSHDTWIYVLAAALGRVSHIAAPLILYRQHDSNAAGLERSTGWRRIAAICAQPTRGMADNRRFDAEMAALFAGMAAHSSGDMAARANVAAARFAARSERLAQRIALYESRSLPTRARAFGAALALQRRDSAAHRRGGAAAAKDLLLGVTGIARRFVG